MIPGSRQFVLPIEEDAWFLGEHLCTLEACKDNQVMYGHIIYIKLFDTLLAICQEILGQESTHSFGGCTELCQVLCEPDGSLLTILAVVF
jgi:hypothetical protein